MVTNGACNLIIRSQFMKQITMNDEDHVALISCRNHEGEIPAPQILCSSNPFMID